MVRLRTKSLNATKLADIFGRTYARRGLRSLAEAAAILGLTKTDTGRLFGITRQAVSYWYKNGVPIERVADVERVADLARVLHARFIPERVPQIVRTPMLGLDDQSILEAVRSSGPTSILEVLDRAFSYMPP